MKPLLSNLSIAQREKLVEHVPGPIEFIAARRRGDQTNSTILCLVSYGLLKTGPQHSIRWTHTELTLAGREIAAKILAGYAEALVAAGALDASVFAERPLVALRRLKREGRFLPHEPGEVPEAEELDEAGKLAL